MADQTYIGGRDSRPVAAKATPGEFLLPVTSISLAARLRPVRQAAVDDLIVSLREGVLGHPVTVRPMGDAYELVIGAHRLTAFQQMGRTTIPAIVRPLTDLEARKLEIDENLIRSGLTALDRMTFLGERIEVWAASNPDQITLDASLPIKRRGRPPQHCFKLKQVDGYVPLTMGFARDTARETDLSPISVYKAARTYAGLPAQQRDRLHGTWIASNDAALRQLAGLGEADEQAAVIDLLLAGKTKSIPEARAIAAGTPMVTKAPSPAAIKDFKAGWKAGTPSQRAEMLAWLAAQSMPRGWTVTEGADQ